MPKPSATEDALSQIRAVREPRDLASFLRHKSNHVIAAAADAIKRMEASALAPDLILAFTGILPQAPKRDPGCKALIAIAEALVSMGEDASEVYLKGIHYVQKEGSFGPPVDAAAPLRGLCVRGLVRIRHSDALYEAVNTLADPETAARAGAVGALGDANSREAELLLRLKVLDGDKDTEVIAECFRSLLSISPARSLEFVARHLDSGSDDRAEGAALALGEARLESALPYLKAAWEKHRRPSLRRTILLSIAMLRNPQGVEFLLIRLNQDPESAAQFSLEALAIYQNDETVRTRVREIVERRKLPAQSWLR